MYAVYAAVVFPEENSASCLLEVSEWRSRFGMKYRCYGASNLTMGFERENTTVVAQKWFTILPKTPEMAVRPARSARPVHRVDDQVQTIGRMQSDTSVNFLQA